MELSDFDDEGIPVIIVNRNQGLPTPQQITVSPPHILALQTVLREVFNNIFKDLMELVESRNQVIHLENYEEKMEYSQGSSQQSP